MTDSTAARYPAGGERDEISLLLPWYANGTLDEGDQSRVDAWLKRDAELRVELATLREDMAEAIDTNEAIAAPPSAALDRLMDQIGAEAPVRRSFVAAGTGFFSWLDELLRSMSPGRLGFAAVAAAVVIALQAGVVGGLLTQGPSSGVNYETASGKPSEAASIVLVQFHDDAPISAVTAYLASVDAEIIAGPKTGGLYEVRVSAGKLDEAERQAAIAKIRSHAQLFKLVLPGPAQ